jgi:hypothetical protein
MLSRRLALPCPEINHWAAEPISRAGAGMWPATVFRAATMAGRPGAELGIRRSAKRSLWLSQISLSKHQRPRTPKPAIFPPRRACGFRPGGERQQMPTTARPSRVMRRAKPVPRKALRQTPRDPSLAAPRLPQPGPARRHLRRPPGARPGQTAPEGERRGTGFANLSGK